MQASARTEGKPTRTLAFLPARDNLEREMRLGMSLAGLAQCVTQVLGQALGLILRCGPEYRLTVDLNLVAEDGVLHTHPGAMASVRFECWHLNPFSEQESCLDGPGKTLI
jgi:hypothetical protein